MPLVLFCAVALAGCGGGGQSANWRKVRKHGAHHVNELKRRGCRWPRKGAALYRDFLGGNQPRTNHLAAQRYAPGVPPAIAIVDAINAKDLAAGRIANLSDEPWVQSAGKRWVFLSTESSMACGLQW